MVLFSTKGQWMVWPGRRSWMVAAVCLAFFAGRAAAQQFSVRNFPVPISIDGERVRSNIFLQFEMKDYGVPFSKFSASHLDPREAVFAELVRGIQKNDPKAVEKVLVQPRPLKINPDDKNGTISAIPTTPEQYAVETVKVYRATFGNFDNIDVIAQVQVGSKSLFVWDAKLPGRPRRRAFSVEAEGPTRLVAREVMSSSPVDVLILSILEEGVKNPSAYAAVPDPHLHYRQPLAIEGKNKTAHEVALLFNGEALDFDAFGEGPVTNPLLAFYRSVFSAFKAHKMDVFLAAHTVKSRAKLQAWWKTFSKENEDAYYLTMVKGRFVKFVMDGDPVYILFYSQTKGKDWIVGSLGYQYVVKNSADQQYQIANVLSEGFFDDVIGKNNLFDQRVLKPPVVPAVPKKAANEK